MSIDLRPNTVVQYKMNDDESSTVVIDTKGTNGTYVSANTKDVSVDGKINQALSFDGAGQYINTNQSWENVFDVDFSVNLWMKPDAGIPSSQQFIFGLFDNASNHAFTMRLRNNGLIRTVYEFNNQGSGSFDTTGPFVDGPDNDFVMITVTVEQSGLNAILSIYSDGSFEDSKTFLCVMGDWQSALDLFVGTVNLDGSPSSAEWEGAIDNFCIFNKVLSQDEIDFLYNSGAGTEKLFEFVVNSPTLTYPNGGETFTEGDINIQWTEPGSPLTTELFWYEIFITDDFNNTKKQELIQIATIPSGNTFYSYTIQKNLRGKKSRIGIRTVNNKGQKSHISFSADDFTIINELLPSPALIEPTEGGTYFSYIPFIFDHNGVLGRSSQRSFYQIYYKSDNQDIDWTLLQGNIMVGTDPINIDVSNFNTDSDYVFKIELVDADSVSAPVFINDININNINVFLIDTEPPTGTIKIIDNNEYTKNTGLIIKLSSSDEVSATKEVQIQQTNVETNNVALGSYIPLTSLITWDIKAEEGETEILDGVKLIQARFRDHGKNTLESITQKYFRTYKNLNNKEITTFLYGSTGIESNLYYVFASDESNDILAELYKDLLLVSTLTGDCTSLAIYNNVLYIGIKDDENKGVLQRLTTTVDTVSDNEQPFLDVAEEVVNSLYFADSVINAMEVFDNTLFLGLDNGELLSFRGSSITSVNDTYLNLKSIRNVKTDGIMLYIFFYNTTEILIMRKNTSGNYVFSTVDTEG